MSRISQRTRGVSSPLFHPFLLLLVLLLTSFSSESDVAAQSALCSPNPCRNGGRCEVALWAPGGYQCICKEPFGGRNCTVANPTCIDSPCLNSGECTDLPNRQFACSCPSGFVGLRCEFRDPCLSRPCMNGAKCQSNNLGSYECLCPPGYAGEGCSQALNSCESGERSPCENNGTCINKPGGYECQCQAGYTGAHCEIRAFRCKPNPCLNGGVCSDKGDAIECTCPRGYAGTRCEDDINDCRDQTCHNGGVCQDLVGGFRCNCQGGWKGEFCDEPMLPCDASPCLHGGTCTNVGPGVADFLCECHPGYNGSKCEVDINDCEGVTCLNGGTCIDRPNAWYCQCPPFYSGERCEIHALPTRALAMTESSSLSSLASSSFLSTVALTCHSGKTCLHNGECVTEDGHEAFCDCPLDWYGEFCEIPVCSEDYCANGGVCKALLVQPRTDTSPSKKESYCECPVGLFGDHCIDKVTKCSPGLCHNGATCEHDDPRGARCLCPPGFGGVQCNRLLRSCSENPCLNNGECIEDSNQFKRGRERLFTCKCSQGYQGDFCESRIVCFDVDCGSHGHCEEDRCVCEEGWTGSRCQEPAPLAQTVASPLTCSDQPCANHAQCLPGRAPGPLFRCLCETALGNFTGPLCATDIDECASQPCRNEGKCVNTPGSFVCRCPAGFEGRLCEARADPCDTTYGPVCANGGTCTTVNGKASCRCPSGFRGDRCEVEANECALRPCLNGGVCVPFFDSYACRCPVAYSGRHCERLVDVSPCSNQTCQNGGYCPGVSILEECHCPLGFYGRYCEVTLNLCHQLLEFSPSTMDGLSPPSSLGRLLGNRRTLSLTAATAALLNSSITASVLSSLHLSRTALGPCYPPGTLQCLPRSSRGALGEDFVCQCRHGFEGRYCEQRRDFCAEASQEFAHGGAVCLNGGHCVNRHRGLEPSKASSKEVFFSCQCPPGFSGTRCELRTPSCNDSNICQNGGICAVEGARLKCICPRGLGGTFCEVDLVDECAYMGNCLNGGKCRDGLGNYTCECSPDFCGQRCELSGFACALEATNDPKRWPGEAAEAEICRIADCEAKAGNGKCDPECDRFACGFDAGECLYAQRKATPILQSHEAKLSTALPWANCSAIQDFDVPCHLKFGDGQCDPMCASEECLFDGWDCQGVAPRAPTGPRTAERTKPAKGVEGSLVLLLGVPPSRLMPEDDEQNEFRQRLLDELSSLLHVRLRVRQQPTTGALMIYPVPLAAVLDTPSQQQKHHQKEFWSLSDGAQQGNVSVSVNRLIFDQEGGGNTAATAKRLNEIIVQLTAGRFNSRTEDLGMHSRRRRSVGETSVGSRVFLEFEESNRHPNDPVGFNNIETAAQFVTAAIRTKRYTPPVDIISVETASPEALDLILAKKDDSWVYLSGSGGGDGGGSILRRSSIRGTLIYCLIALICGLVLLTLLGVLYNIMQRERPHASDAGSPYAKKKLIKRIRTTAIWFPRNSTSSSSRQHQQTAGGSGNVLGCFSEMPSATVGASSSRSNMATPHSSKFSLWTREKALAEGCERVALRSAPYPPPSTLVSNVAYQQQQVAREAGDTSNTSLLMQMPQVDVKAYFTSLMESLVSGDGLTEPFTEGLVQKLEYLRSVEMQQQQAELMYRGASATGSSGGHRHCGKRSHSTSLLSQLLTSTIPDSGETLLHLAARYNCASALTALLNAGADPHAVDASGSSVLLTAVCASAMDAARALLSDPQVAAAGDLPRLFIACPTEDKTTPLIQAVKLADIDMVEMLLQVMATLIPEPSPLQQVMPQVSGANGPAYPGMPAPGGSMMQQQQQQHAQQQNRRPPLDPRLGVGYSTRLCPPSTTCSSSSLPEDASAGGPGLSTNSFGVNATDGEGRTALHWAALTEQPAMVQLLLRSGASHDVQTLHEETPLTLAAREGSLEACSLLLAAGANAEIADFQDRTPKQLAAQNGHKEVVRLLQTYASNSVAAAGAHQQHQAPVQSAYSCRRTLCNPPVVPQQTQQQAFYQVQNNRGYYQYYSDTAGPSYEKRIKYEPAEYSKQQLQQQGESFLMQLVPVTSGDNAAAPTTTTTSASGGVGTVEEVKLSKTSPKGYFFDQPPPPPSMQTWQQQQQQSACNGVGGGGCTYQHQQLTSVPAGSAKGLARPTNGHTPSSDTESPAHWSSPSPTAISPPQQQLGGGSVSAVTPVVTTTVTSNDNQSQQQYQQYYQQAGGNGSINRQQQQQHLQNQQGNEYRHHQQPNHHQQQQQGRYSSSRGNATNNNGDTEVPTTASATTKTTSMSSSGVEGVYDGVNYAPQSEDRIKLEPRVY